jgi:hypothetical protein
VCITLVKTQTTLASVYEDKWNSTTKFNENLFSVTHVIAVTQTDRQADRQTCMVKPINASFATSHSKTTKKPNSNTQQQKKLYKLLCFNFQAPSE